MAGFELRWDVYFPFPLQIRMSGAEHLTRPRVRHITTLRDHHSILVTSEG